MKFNLRTALSPKEADILSQTLAFTRKAAPSGKRWFAEFANQMDLSAAERLVDGLRNTRPQAAPVAAR